MSDEVARAAAAEEVARAAAEAVPQPQAAAAAAEEVAQAAAEEEVAQAAAEAVPQPQPAASEEVAQAAAEGVPQAAASPPPGPSPQRPSEDEFFCSFQNSVEDVQIHVFDVAKESPAYMGTLAAMRSRQLALSPFLFHGAPVTPLTNPKTSFSSHFIIRLFNSKNLRYMVDCLVRDSDLYFVGFRRHLLLTAEEEAQLEKERKSSLPKRKKKGKGNEEEEKEKGGWGIWYRFSGDGFRLPKYFEAESCGISSDYADKTQATAGGVAAVEEMLFALATFQDKPIVDTAFKKACYRFMIMFCEACRLRSVFRVIIKRFDDDITYVVPNDLWASINSWAQRGRDALDARLKGRDLNFDISNKRIKVNGQILETLDDLVGPHYGEVMLIRSNRTMMGYTSDEIQEITRKAVQTNTGPADRREIDFSLIR